MTFLIPINPNVELNVLSCISLRTLQQDANEVGLSLIYKKKLPPFAHSSAQSFLYSLSITSVPS